jgi:hypothetical protein
MKADLNDCNTQTGACNSSFSRWSGLAQRQQDAAGFLLRTTVIGNHSTKRRDACLFVCRHETLCIKGNYGETWSA